MLAIFDVEGVLYDAEYLPLLAEKVNKEKKIWEITKKGIEGKIDWVEGLKERVHLLRGMDYDTCIQVANSLPIMTGAKEACSVLKNAGWKIMAVSGGFTIITDRLKKDLGLDFVYSNELVFKDGKLDDVIVNVDADKSKSAIIKINEWNEKKEDITAVVDGANDIKLFDITGLGIAFRAQDLVKDLATVTLDEKDLTKIISLINTHYNIKTGITGICVVNLNVLTAVFKTNRMALEIIPVKIQKEIESDDDLVNLILESSEINDDDILVFSQKIISKNEGRILSLSSVKPSLLLMV